MRHELMMTTQTIKEELNKDGKSQKKESNRNLANKKSLYSNTKTQ
jgi:hypothetical protein